MKNKFLALTLVALLILPMSIEAAEISPTFPKLYESTGITLDYAAPINRATFSMLTFESFRIRNAGSFPNMEAKNIFSDLSGTPEDVFVVMLYGLGVVNGVGNDTFAPRRAITREEAATMLTRALLCQNPNLISEVQTASLEGFSDADSVSNWAKESVAYLYAKNIFPLKNNMLAPKDTLSTEEAMVLCTAFIGL